MGILVIEKKRLSGRWQVILSVPPRPVAGSVPHVAHNGTREAIMFRCLGDFSVISRAVPITTYDTAASGSRPGTRARLAITEKPPEVLATLRNGDSYEKELNPAGLGRPYKVKWTHRDR